MVNTPATPVEPRLNSCTVNDSGVVVFQFTYFMDVVSTNLALSTDVLPNEKHWGVVVTSKTSKDPIIGIVVATEENLIKALDTLHSSVTSICQFNETTLIIRPILLDNGEKTTDVLQSLTVSNSIYSHNIESLDYSELDQQQLLDLITTQNAALKRSFEKDEAASEADNSDESAG